MSKIAPVRFAFVAAALALFVASARGETRTHVVRSGETLGTIAAAELGDASRWREIAAANGIRDPHRIRIGQALRIPGPTPAPDTPEILAPAEIDPLPPDTAPPRPAAAEPTRSPNLPPALARPDSVATDPRHAAHAPRARSPHPPGTRVLRDAEEAVALARIENADLAAATEDVEAARAGLVTAGLAGRFNPEVEASVGRRSVPAEGEDPARDVTDWGIGVSREFEIAGQYGHRMSVARLELERAAAEAEAREREIVAGVRDAYAKAQAAVHHAEFAREAERIRQSLSEAARIRFEAGDAARIEVALVEVEASRATSERIESEREARAALSDLRRAIGLGPGAPIAVDEDPHGNVEERPAPRAEDVVVQALRERRDLRSARLGERIAAARSDLVLAEGRPNVRLGAEYEREEGSQDIVRAGVSIPLPLVNQNRGEAERFRREAAAARLRADALERRVTEEVRTAVDAVVAAAERLALLEERAVSATDENLRLLEEAYREGKVGLAEVVVFQTEALASRTAAHEALHELADAWVALERAVGTTTHIEGGDSR